MKFISRRFFRLYESWTEETQLLSAEEKGRLIDSLVEYVRTGKEAPPPGVEKLIYPVFVERIKRENETHERKREERREARGQ